MKVSEMTYGFVWAKCCRLELLDRRGALVVMDSTHKTNALGWRLFTLMTRTEEATWIPVAHMLVPVENGVIVAAGLKKIREWCPRWQLRWMLTDDSAVEQLAVRTAFPGTAFGDARDVTHLLCRVHVRRTLDRRWSPASKNHDTQQIRRHLKAALYARRTAEGCEESLCAARRHVKEEDRAYFDRNWWDTRAQWAHFARNLHSILLQVFSTNAVETWHSVLKARGDKAQMLTWSLSGIVQHVANCAHDYDIRAERARADFRSKHASETKRWPGLALLPYPAQKLCVKQLHQCRQMLAEGGDPPLWPLRDAVRCDCLFWRQYKLPCVHIFYQDAIFGGVLTQRYWEEVGRMFAEEGFEIYEGLDGEYAAQIDEPELFAPETMTLQWRSFMEELNEGFYRFRDSLTSLAPELQEQAWEFWQANLRSITGSVRQQAVREHLVGMGAERLLDAPYDVVQIDTDEPETTSMAWDELFFETDGIFDN